jgi:glycosyltransferase involved in cell wall biosynthesis
MAPHLPPMESEARQAAMAPITMAHIFPSFAYGGQQTRFAALAGGLGRGFAHHVVALDGDRAARALIAPDVSVTFHDFKARKSSLASIRNIVGFGRLFKTIKPDILCTYNWGAMEAVLANRLGAGAPNIHFEDGFGAGEDPARQKTRRVWARRFWLHKSVVVAPSARLENLATDVWKLNRKRVIRIPNGVDFERFQVTPAGLNRHIEVGSIGALRPEKNYLRLIAAFLKADPEKKAKLTIVGEGPERAALAAAIKQAGANARISLPGATQTPEQFYCNFDAYAVSSDTEQAPLTLMEAMAAGLPVASTNVGDVADIVADENRAFITPLGDENAFTLALTHLIQNSDTRSTLGAANRRKAKKEYDAAKMIERHRVLYLSMARLK